MSIIFQKNNISFGDGTLFAEVSFAGWSVTPENIEEEVSKAIRMMHVEHRNGTTNIYTVPSETHARLPELSDITINGPYIEKDGNAEFEYIALRNPGEPNKILAILTKEMSTKTVQVAMGSNVACGTCGARS